MRFISAADIDRLLTFPRLVDALDATFASGATSPMRHHHGISRHGAAQATHLIMPAWTSGAPGAGAFLGTKIVNVFPENGGLGLPAVLGVYVLQSGETGAPLAILDGTRLTHWRTAAASALASRYLSAPGASRLVLVGAGALAPFLVRAHRSVRPIVNVVVWNHRVAGAERLVEILAREGIAAHVAHDLEAAVAEADIVSCATLSSEPIVRGAWLAPGTHLDLVGAFSMTMREADDEALGRGRLFVDTPAALHEGGDVAIAIRDGGLEAGAVAGDLFGLCGRTLPGRTSREEVTVFKSCGTAIEDLAAAILVWNQGFEPQGSG